jgi:hypothetical protein
MIHHGGGEAALQRKLLAAGYQIKSCAEQISNFHLEHVIPERPNHFQDGTQLNDWSTWTEGTKTETENPDTWGQYPVEEIHL